MTTPRRTGAGSEPGTGAMEEGIASARLAGLFTGATSADLEERIMGVMLSGFWRGESEASPGDSAAGLVPRGRDESLIAAGSKGGETPADRGAGGDAFTGTEGVADGPILAACFGSVGGVGTATGLAAGALALDLGWSIRAASGPVCRVMPRPASTFVGAGVGVFVVMRDLASASVAFDFSVADAGP